MSSRVEPSPAVSPLTAVPAPPARPLPLMLRRHSLVATVENALRMRCGVSSTASLLVGCSGGADSLAALLSLLVLRDRGDVGAIRVAHVHHHLRVAEADEDAAFVREICATLGLPFDLLHIHPARESGNLAAAARDLRYRALSDLASSHRIPHVVVGHHADDQFETLLIALCRGTGLAGMAGMPWSRSLRADVTLVRPLLEVRKSACIDLCRSAGFTWRNDSSNFDSDAVRARLRADVLPHLEMIWPEASRRVSIFADVCRTAESCIEQAVASTFGPPSNREWSRDVLNTLEPVIMGYGLRRAFCHMRPAYADHLSQRHMRVVIDAIRQSDTKPRAFDWPGASQLHVTFQTVSLKSTDP